MNSYVIIFPTFSGPPILPSVHRSQKSSVNRKTWILKTLHPVSIKNIKHRELEMRLKGIRMTEESEVCASVCVMLEALQSASSFITHLLPSTAAMLNRPAQHRVPCR